MYKAHRDIPNNYRRIILDETLATRVSQVPLSVCNEIIEQYEQKELDNESLQSFEVIVVRDGKRTVQRFKDSERAYVALDRAIGYDVHDTGVTAVLQQAGRLIKAYVKGQWIKGSVSIYDRF